MRLTNWFEISEKEYIWYKLQGYNIDAGEYRVIWRLDDQLHRADGPAYIGADGYRVWYLNGKLHRTDGPAVIKANGDRAWYLNGNLHRTNGPAIIWADGDQFWYLNGSEYTEQEWKNAVSELV